MAFKLHLFQNLKKKKIQGLKCQFIFLDQTLELKDGAICLKKKRMPSEQLTKLTVSK